MGRRRPHPPEDARDALLRDLAAHVRNPRVLDAVGRVPRDRFVPRSIRRHAWDDEALPIACGQTISQPRVVARMCDLLELQGSERILDVGTGSGYHAAVLAQLGAEVVSVERHAELARRARAVLDELGVRNVAVHLGDGSQGWPPDAPYDAINVAAAAGPGVPPALEHQLALGGRLVVPVGDDEQRLLLVRRTGRGLEREVLDPVRFVPLVE
ncbi:MAG TPA: protein-L-isoaspartate(D-aspartate) O-methyltransferase [Baekduia sp.]|nr:protein-L-isoaspartate(D-aspartate) O-methyltransferase [Baekduia sp.]